jgi:hypothetical protein
VTSVTRELLLNLTDRLIGANQRGAALTTWNSLQQFPAPDRASGGVLVNRNFERQSSGHGFDWRVTQPPQGSVHWESSRLEYWLSASTPHACALLEQWVMLDPGRYRLRFGYRTEGLAEKTGLRWMVRYGGSEDAPSAVLAPTPRRVPNGNVAEWNFRVTKAGLYELAWIYQRVPGTIHQEGRAELTFAGLEAP